MNSKTILQGFGAAMLVLLLRVWPLLSSRHSAFYHSFLHMQSVVWGNLIDVIVLSLLLATIFVFLQKGEGGDPLSRTAKGAGCHRSLRRDPHP